MATGKEIGPAAPTLVWPGDLAILSGWERLISKSWHEDNFRFWDALTGKNIKNELNLGMPECWNHSTDGKTLAVFESSQPAKGQATIKLWDLKKNREILRLESSTKVRSLALSTDGSLLAVRSKESSSVQIWNVTTGKEVGTLGQNLSAEREWFVDYLTFSPDGAMLVSKRVLNTGFLIGIDPRLPSEMYFRDVRTGKELDRFANYKTWCDWVSFSPDSKMITTVRIRKNAVKANGPSGSRKPACFFR